MPVILRAINSLNTHNTGSVSVQTRSPLKMISMFQNCEIVPEPSFQVLPKNILDKEVQRIAYSFNFAFNVFCSSKYRIRDNHVYPNGKKYYMLSFLYMLVINFISIFRMFYLDFLSIDGIEDHLGNGFTVFLTLVFCIGFFNRFYNVVYSGYYAQAQ